MTATPNQIVRALQYLYYTCDGNHRLGGSPISDFDYDKFCKNSGIDGNGGSDHEKDYTSDEVALAEKIAETKRIENL